MYSSRPSTFLSLITFKYDIPVTFEKASDDKTRQYSRREYKLKQIYRNDRQSENFETRHGGVLVAFRNHIKRNEITLPKCKKDIAFVKKTQNQNLHLDVKSLIKLTTADNSLCKWDVEDS